jgi:hypothetical protein
MKVSNLVIPAAVILAGGRVAYSQYFKSYKYGFLFDFGPHHQVVGMIILFLGVALACLVWKSDKVLRER